MNISGLQILAVEVEQDDDSSEDINDYTDPVNDSNQSIDSSVDEDLVTIVPAADQNTTISSTMAELPSANINSSRSGDQDELSRTSLIQLLFLAFFVFLLGLMNCSCKYEGFVPQEPPAAPSSPSPATGSRLTGG